MPDFIYLRKLTASTPAATASNLAKLQNEVINILKSQGSYEQLREVTEVEWSQRMTTRPMLEKILNESKSSGEKSILYLPTLRYFHKPAIHLKACLESNLEIRVLDLNLTINHDSYSEKLITQVQNQYRIRLSKLKIKVRKPRLKKSDIKVANIYRLKKIQELSINAFNFLKNEISRRSETPTYEQLVFILYDNDIPIPSGRRDSRGIELGWTESSVRRLLKKHGYGSL